MEDVRFYDFECRLLHIEHNIVSCNWTLYENDIGTFEMHFPLESNLTRIAAEHQYLVAVQGTKQAIIVGRSFLEEGILYGSSCNWILTKFCIAKPFTTKALLESKEISGTDAQTVCRYLCDSGMSGVSNFVFQESEEGFGEVSLENGGVNSVFSLIQETMKQVDGGHQLCLDVTKKCWIFSLTKGKQLPITLSEDNLNIYDSEYFEDMQNLCQGGYYEQKIENMGEWNIYQNSPSLENNNPKNYATGYRVSLSERQTGYETYSRFGLTFRNGDYIVCKNREGAWEKAYDLGGFIERVEPTLSGIYAWETFLNGNNLQEATQKLDQHRILRRITVKTREFIFGRDYKLGDFVMQRIAKGSLISTSVRKITGVNLWYETDETGEQPIFSEEEFSWDM